MTPSVLPQNAVWEAFGDRGEPAHFYHANGFPLGVYKPLLSKLDSGIKLSALHLRATWPNIGLPQKRRDWHIYADDLIAFVEQEYKEPIIGIGHSMGATCTILAAQKRPELFKTLILVEVAMVSARLARLAPLVPTTLWNYLEPVKSTLAKVDTWSSREAYLDQCKQFKAYKRFEESSFRALANYGLIETQDNQLRLAFPKIWEAQNYTQPPNVMDALESLEIPCFAIRGKPSVFFSDSMWQEWQQRSPSTIFMENPSYGHLFPFENSTACAKLINSAISYLS